MLLIMSIVTRNKGLTSAGRHEAYFRSKDRQTLELPVSGDAVTLEKDELLNIEWSYKVCIRVLYRQVSL